MRLILIGPPGAGKGTQAAHLVKELKIPHVSSGDMLRERAQRDPDLGERLKAGELVPDDLVINLILARIAAPDAAAGFILDGFPRTVPQAHALKHALATVACTIDRVLLIEVPDDHIVTRITGRRSDPLTGRIYHLAFDPPPEEITHRLVHRKDDTEDAVRTRLGYYHRWTAPVIPFYAEAGVLRRIDGVGSPADVAARVTAALQP